MTIILLGFVFGMLFGFCAGMLSGVFIGEDKHKRKHQYDNKIHEKEGMYMNDKIKSVKKIIESQSKLNALDRKIVDLEHKLFQKESIIAEQAHEIEHLKHIYQDLQIRNEYIYENKIKRKGSVIKIAKLIEKRIEHTLANTDSSVNEDIECYIRLIEHLKGELQ